MPEHSRAWWLKRLADEPHRDVYGIAHAMRDEQSDRQMRALTNLCFYGGEPIVGLGLTEYAHRGTGDRSSINAVKNMVNALHAEITQQRPRMTVVTSGGDFELKQHGKGLDKLIEGQTAEDGQDDLSPQLAKLALAVGDGVQKTFCNHLNDRVEIERVLPWELIVPEAEAYYGQPRTIYHVTNVDRDVLAATYEDKSDEIKHAENAELNGYFSLATDQHSDLVTVVEAWHLPSRVPSPLDDPDDEEETDGAHVVCVSNATLFAEPWRKGRFPFDFLKWEMPLLGFWSTSFVDDLRGEQIMINRLDRHIKESLQRGGLKILMDRQAGVIKSHIDDLIGTIIEGDFSRGKEPQFINYATLHPEVTQQIAWRLEQIYAHNGVNQMSAQAMVPAGLNSGKAIRAFEQSKSKRFIDFAKRYEQFHKRVAEYKVELIREVYERTGKYAVTYHGKKEIELVDWSKFSGLKPHQYRIRVFPTSALPASPAGRIATLEEWMNAGLITPADFKRLADFPDLESFADLENASHDLIEKMIDAMLDRGEPQTPEPMMDLTLAMSMATNAYLLAKVRGWYPESHLTLLREFVTACSDMLNPPPEEDPNALGGGPVMPPTDVPPGVVPPDAGMPPMPPEGMPPAGEMPPGGMPMPPPSGAPN